MRGVDLSAVAAEVWTEFAVVYALHRQSKNRPAWVHMLADELFPLDEDTARVAIAVSGEAGCLRRIPLCGCKCAPAASAGRVEGPLGVESVAARARGLRLRVH